MRGERYEKAIRSVQLAFGIVKQRYKTELPNPAKARINEFVFFEGKISVAILSDDVDGRSATCSRPTSRTPTSIS